MINWDFFQRITKNWIDKQKISLQSQLLVFYDESRVFPHPLAVFRPYLHFVNQLSFSRGDKCNLSLWRDGFILIVFYWNYIMEELLCITFRPANCSTANATDKTTTTTSTSPEKPWLHFHLILLTL